MTALEYGDPAEIITAYVDAAELLAALWRRPAWHGRAACAGMGTDTFFPGPGGGRDSRRICAGCPVRLECLRFALSTTDLDGQWAGTTPRQRRRLRTAGQTAEEVLADLDARRRNCSIWNS